MQLSGARTLLTGATGGIGEAIARRLAHEGVELVCSGRSEERLEYLAGELGARVVAADLTRRDDVSSLLTAVGPIDLLIANAALPASGRITMLEQTHIDRALEVNLRAPLALAHAYVPAMLAAGHGHIVFIGSIAGRAASGGASIYNATKFGLRGAAIALRDELAPGGVGVSLISPGFIRDAGMFADTAIRLPRGVGTRTPADVADALVRAVTEDRGEVCVAPAAVRAGAAFAQLAPQLARRLARRVGSPGLALEFERRQADKR